MSTLVAQLLALAERIGVEAKDLRLALESKGAMIGEVKLLAFATVPAGWLVCNGATLAQTSYPELYAVIGKAFGGGASTYALPDFTSHLPRQADASLALGGTSSVGGTVELPLSFTLDEANLPAHTHTALMWVTNDAATEQYPAPNLYIGTGTASGNAQPQIYSMSRDEGLVALNDETILVQNAGLGQAVSTTAEVTLPAAMPPVVGMNYVIYAGAAA